MQLTANTYRKDRKERVCTNGWSFLGHLSGASQLTPGERDVNVSHFVQVHVLVHRGCSKIYLWSDDAKAINLIITSTVIQKSFIKTK